MADMIGQQIVCVFYKVTIDDFRQDKDGLGPFDDWNMIDINDFSTYLTALTQRARS